MEGEDTSHKFLQKIDYVIGSGNHTNSHIFSINGYLHQLPYTFYTQEKKSRLFHQDMKMGIIVGFLEKLEWNV